jgi:hypothetical protein
MNAYESATPRFAIAVAAFALSALTIGTMVVAPAQFDEGFAPSDTVLAARPADARPVEVAIVPARIEVVAMREPSIASTHDLRVVGTREPNFVGTREPNVAWAMGGPAQPNCKPDV